jgi:beta-lysine 5,6-aminomutase alpha subunit
VVALPIDPGIVDACRERARAIAAAVQAFIDRHSTVSIERTVLRAFGVEGADPDGVPLVNTCVERYRAAGRLGPGIAYYVGRRLCDGAADPQDAVESLAYGAELDDAGAGPSLGEIEAALAPHTERALARLDQARDKRLADMERLGVGGPASREPPQHPLKYVIVATGNIYDDADQACAAAQAGADIIAVIRSTAQSLLDYVPIGATTEGFGGTWATQENFRIVRAALDEEQEKQHRYLQLCNYSSGLCMAEIAYMGAVERLDMLLNDAMYGILFRDINPRRTLLDQYVSRRLIARAGITINTGEDNYLTTADAVEAAHTVITSQFINEALARCAGCRDQQMGLGHAFEIDKTLEDSFLLELAQAQLVRQLFPDHPIKWMPATKHKTGDIFWAHRMDGLFDLIGVMTQQRIELLGMLTEAVHTPYLHDRFIALKGADYVFTAARHLGEEICWNPDGRIVRRARAVLDQALALLDEVEREGMFAAIARGAFGDIRRAESGGKGAEGVFERAPGEGYVNPILAALEAKRSEAAAPARPWLERVK